MGAIKESFITNIVMPVAEKMMGTCAMQWLHKIREMNMWSANQITEWQNEQLRHFVKHAYEHTKYYKNLFDQLNIRPDEIQTISDLKRLPRITKYDVIEHFDELKADDADLYPHRLCHTGGSTGEPMYYLFDEQCWGYDTAAKIIAWQSTGYHYGEPFIALGSASLFKKKAGFIRRVYDSIRGEIALNCLNLGDELCFQYVTFIKKKKIKYIYGYAGALYTLALYCKRNHIDLTQISVAFSTSENLTPLYREMIETTWQCRVMDCWGCRDAGLATFEVVSGQYYVGYNSILESVDTLSDGMGTILSTNILNYSMPLIRYEFGDVAKLEDSTFNKQYNGQIVTEVMGRVSDLIPLKNGHTLTAPGFTILMLNFDVIAYDIKPINTNEGIVMRVQRGPQYNQEQENMLKAELERLCGAGAIVRIEYVSGFDQCKNGKHRFFMNEI